MSAAPLAAEPPHLPDPPPDRPATHAQPPSRTARLLTVVRQLIGYGKYLTNTLQQHACARNLGVVTRHRSMVARRFGIGDIAAILLLITRALRRATVLEATLVSLGDQPLAMPVRSSAPAPRQPSATRPPHQRPAPTTGHVHLPTAAQIRAELRRRPAGAVLVDICRDLGIVPSHPLWRELESVIVDNGGDITRLVKAAINRYRFATIADPAPTAPGAAATERPALSQPAPAVSGAGPPEPWPRAIAA